MVIYSGATVLGRVTIGAGSVIGGNVWLTHSVPPGSRVSQGHVRRGILRRSGHLRIRDTLREEGALPRYKLTIEYAGTRYSGWQIQKNARTVQGELPRAICGGAPARRPRDFQGSGRTDAGVHALAQVAHVDLRHGVAPEALRRRVNDALPADIHVLAVAARVAPVPRPALRAVAAATSTRSRAGAPRSPSPSCGGSRTSWTSTRDAAARRGSRGCTTSARSPTATPRRDPRRCCWTVSCCSEDGDLVLVRIAGSHFVWKMVGGSSACWWRWGAGRPDASSRRPASWRNARRCLPASPRRRRACSSSGSPTPATRQKRPSAPPRRYGEPDGWSRAQPRRTEDHEEGVSVASCSRGLRGCLCHQQLSTRIRSSFSRTRSSRRPRCRAPGPSRSRPRAPS